MGSKEKGVEEFQTAMDQPIDIEFNKHQLMLRMSFIDEEVAELREEVMNAIEELTTSSFVSQKLHTKIIKELCDVMYVISGFAVTFGLPIDEAFSRIHKSNMSKMVDGKPVKNEQGKVLKGPNYNPPNLNDLVAKQLDFFKGRAF